MISGLKTMARRWRREGRMPWLVNTASVLWYQSKNLRDWMNFGEVRRALRDGVPADLDAQIDFVMSNFGEALKPIQNREELRSLIETVRARRPKTVLEIGTAKGGTLLLLCKAAAPDATIISLDLPYGRNGGGFPRWKESTYRQFAEPGQKIHLIRGNSHEQASYDKVTRLLEGRRLDFLMIDGDHSFEGVRADFEMYGPLIGEDGLIAIHDILENRFDPSIDVHRYWRELCASHRTEEIVADRNQGNLGIGLVHLGA